MFRKGCMSYLLSSFLGLTLCFALSVGICYQGFSQEKAISTQLPEEYTGNWYSLTTNGTKFKTPAFFRFFNNLVEHEQFKWMYAELHKKDRGFELRIRRNKTEKTFYLELYSRGILKVKEGEQEPFWLKRQGLEVNEDFIERSHEVYEDELVFLPKEYQGYWKNLGQEKGAVEFLSSHIRVKEEGEINEWKAYHYGEISKTQDEYLVKGFRNNEERTWKIKGTKRWGGIKLEENGIERILYEPGIESHAQIEELDRIVEMAFSAIRSKDKPLELPHKLESLSIQKDSNDGENMPAKADNPHRFLYGKWYATDGSQHLAYEFHPWYFKSYPVKKDENGMDVYGDNATQWIYVNMILGQKKKEAISFLAYNGDGGIMFMEVDFLEAPYIEIAGKIFKKQSNMPDLKIASSLNMKRVLNIPVANCEEHIQLSNHFPFFVSKDIDLNTWRNGYWPSTSAIFDQNESWVMIKTPLKGQLFEGFSTIPQRMESPTLSFKAYVDSLKVYVDGKMVYFYPWKSHFGFDRGEGKVKNVQPHLIDLPKDYYGKTIYIHSYKKVDANFDGRFGSKTAIGTFDHRSGISNVSIGTRTSIAPLATGITNSLSYQSGLVFFAILLGTVSLLCIIISWRQKGELLYERLGIGLFLMGAALMYGFPYTFKTEAMMWWLPSEWYIYLRLISQALIVIGWLYFAKELYKRKWYHALGTLIIAHIIVGGTQLIHAIWFPLDIPDLNYLTFEIGSWRLYLPLAGVNLSKGISNALVGGLYSVYHILIFFDVLLIVVMVGKNWYKVDKHSQIALIVFAPLVANTSLGDVIQRIDGEPLVFLGTNLILQYVVPMVCLLYYLANRLIKDYITNTQKIHDFTLELERKQNELLRFEQAQMQSEYQALKSQISPHFLFNTFSSLMTVIEESQNKAVNFVQELSTMYRYLLQSKNRELETLDRELDFIQSYMFLLRDRFGDNLRLHNQVNEKFLIRQIPALSLHLLVENAVKHNVISAQRPLDIYISIEDNTYLVVRNNLQRKNTLEESTQIGLENIKNRYAFYTEKEVVIEEEKGSFSVKIPFIQQITKSENKD